jgi:inorganic pyrophosphatase
MHPWHDYPIDEATIADHVPAIIEVPMGSKNKYELVHPLTIVDVRAIGVMQMRDEKSIDDKLLPGLQHARGQGGRGDGAARAR